MWKLGFIVKKKNHVDDILSEKRRYYEYQITDNILLRKIINTNNGNPLTYEIEAKYHISTSREILSFQNFPKRNNDREYNIKIWWTKETGNDHNNRGGVNNSAFRYFPWKK